MLGKILLVPFFALFLSNPLFAEEQIWLEVDKDLEVFAQPQPGPSVLIIPAGETVPMERKRYGQYFRVYIEFKGKLRGGYILASEVAGFGNEEKVLPPKFSRKREEQSVRKSYWGIRGGAGLFQQLSGELEANSGQVFDVSELQGPSQLAGLFLDFPIDDELSFHLSVNYRSVESSGDASVVLTSSSEPSDFEREQTHVSVGGALQFYSTPTSRFWYGGGMELAKVLSSTLSFDSGTDVDSDPDQIALRVILHLGVGYDISISENWQVVPQISASSIVNDAPVSFIYEASFSLKRAF